MRFGGIDPGLDGALAVVDTETHAVEFYDPPLADVEKKTKTKAGNKKHKRVYLPAEMARIIRDARLGFVTIELTVPMPAFSVGGRRVAMPSVSAFGSGEGYGLWQGVLAALGVPFQLVHPARWKAALMAGMPKVKEASCPVALRLYPAVSGELYGPKGGARDGRADALLLCHYGLSGLR